MTATNGNCLYDLGCVIFSFVAVEVIAFARVVNGRCVGRSDLAHPVVEHNVTFETRFDFYKTKERNVSDIDYRCSPQHPVVDVSVLVFRKFCARFEPLGLC